MLQSVNTTSCPSLAWVGDALTQASGFLQNVHIKQNKDRVKISLFMGSILELPD
jgi:hypothetical protein